MSRYGNNQYGDERGGFRNSRRDSRDRYDNTFRRSPPREPPREPYAPPREPYAPPRESYAPPRDRRRGEDELPMQYGKRDDYSAMDHLGSRSASMSETGFMGFGDGNLGLGIG
eukprot:CAMPEP_0198223518 /NCGR_PEP_ID=MMETSP1445-20131203/92868_1 /TAXON_ID=36898 /ORGANISM="Pyramimonas sp., Strain CCMP2087" /LENGTH=112 /DNA_ID=CAMNT_0043902375 /DNA_START=32 /DNA_END=367 /DNA_ORIENTATION=+